MLRSAPHRHLAPKMHGASLREASGSVGTAASLLADGRPQGTSETRACAGPRLKLLLAAADRRGLRGRPCLTLSLTVPLRFPLAQSVRLARLSSSCSPDTSRTLGIQSCFVVQALFGGETFEL